MVSAQLTSSVITLLLLLTCFFTLLFPRSIFSPPYILQMFKISVTRKCSGISFKTICMRHASLLPRACLLLLLLLASQSPLAEVWRGDPFHSKPSHKPSEIQIRGLHSSNDRWCMHFPLRSHWRSTFSLVSTDAFKARFNQMRVSSTWMTRLDELSTQNFCHHRKWIGRFCHRRIISMI